IYGTVVSGGDKSALPGVTVTLAGAATQTQATDSQGKFRFLGLAPGSYDLNVEIQGFTPVEQKGISVNIGRNTNVEVTLQPAIEGETINVIADRSELLHFHDTGKTTVVTLTDLEKT